jgi:hypothetical protein
MESEVQCVGHTTKSEAVVAKGRRFRHGDVWILAIKGFRLEGC